MTPLKKDNSSLCLMSLTHIEAQRQRGGGCGGDEKDEKDEREEEEEEACEDCSRPVFSLRSPSVD